jgi:Ser/Thr protein kinase RdoA (MazF antagonist)
MVNDRSVSLIDFDDSGFGFRLYDLGTALVQTVEQPEHPALREALMAGYGTTDHDLVEAFILARALASVGLTISRLSRDHPVNKSHLARAIYCAEQVLGRL